MMLVVVSNGCKTGVVGVDHDSLGEQKSDDKGLEDTSHTHLEQKKQ